MIDLLDDEFAEELATQARLRREGHGKDCECHDCELGRMRAEGEGLLESTEYSELAFWDRGE